MFKAINADDAINYINMKTLLIIVGAIAFVAIFAFCETSLLLAAVSAAVWCGCTKLIEKYYFEDDEKNERV